MSALALDAAADELTIDYARISDDRHEGAGVERQHSSNRGMADRRGWGNVIELTDNDIGASRYVTKSRPSFERLRELVRTGRVARVVFWDIERMYRRPIELEQMFQLLDDVEKMAQPPRIYSSANGGTEYATDANGRWLQRLLVANAAREVDKMSERLREERQQKREHGLAHGGTRTFGRRWENKRLVTDPVEAELIRSAARSVLSGSSYKDVADNWNALGVPTVLGYLCASCRHWGPQRTCATCGREGRPSSWRTATVWNLFSNPRLAGKLTHNGEIIGDAAWEPILDETTWHDVQATVRARANFDARAPRRRGLLTGVLSCSFCGAHLVKHMTRIKPQRFCVTEGCRHVAIDERAAEEVIVQALFVYVDTLDFAELVRRMGADSGVEACATQVGAAQRRREDVREQMANGALGAADGAAVLRRIDAELKGLQQQLQARAVTSPLEPYTGRGVLRGAWASLTLDQQRTLIRAAFATIRVLPATSRGVFDPHRIELGERYPA